MTEKPLHVRVAEALGCNPGPPYNPSYDGWRCRCKPTGKEISWGPHAGHVFHPCHDHEGLGCDDTLARYDLDWSATGPLIARFGLTVRQEVGPDGVTVSDGPRRHYHERWAAWLNETAHGGDYANGPTPLVAVCRLVLFLHEVGRLPPA